MHRPVHELGQVVLNLVEAQALLLTGLIFRFNPTIWEFASIIHTYSLNMLGQDELLAYKGPHGHIPKTQAKSTELWVRLALSPG